MEEREKASLTSGSLDSLCRNDTQPLDSVEQLWNWTNESIDSSLVSKISLVNYVAHRESVSETLICHDMKGGYLPEESMSGCQVSTSFNPYIVLHWWYVDIFAYFSHHFVTIPPLGWIDQAHSHGVVVLGTLITEWESGANKWSQILHSIESIEITVNKLVEIAKFFNFEGWLVNIENEIEKSKIDLLEKFLQTLTKRLRTEIGLCSRVIWYDAVTVEGQLKWQNSLNNLNERWFHCTDGIFLNYGWNPKELSIITKRANQRRHQVYVGVDCFGRGCYGGGGWNCYEAFKYIRKNDLSVALFAPGWIVETLPNSNIILNSLRFWDRLSTLVYARPITTLPIRTNFSIGFHQVEDGYQCYNLSHAALQPHYLASGAFPATTGDSLILPGQADYKLFEMDLRINGCVRISVDCDSILNLLVWKENNERDLPIRFTQKQQITDIEQQWIVELNNEHFTGIGFECKQLAIVKRFSLEIVVCR